MKKEKSKEMLNRHSQNVGTSIPLLLFPGVNILSNISSYDPQCSTSLWNSQERSWYTYVSINNASTSYPGKRSSLTDAEYEITWWENFMITLPVTENLPSFYNNWSWLPLSLSPSSAEFTTGPQWTFPGKRDKKWKEYLGETKGKGKGIGAQDWFYPF